MSRNKIETLCAKVRAGRDPETQELYITQEDFLREVNALINEARIEELEKLLDNKNKLKVGVLVALPTIYIKNEIKELKSKQEGEG